MKKRIWALMSLLALPLVAAENGLATRGFISVVSFILGNVVTVNEALTKLALWAVLFAALTQGFGKIFRESNAAATVLSIIISIAGIRLMPYVWLGGLSKLLWIAAVIIIPYIIVNLLVSDWSLLKIVLLLAMYFVVYLLVAGIEFFGFDFIDQFVTDFRYFYSVYKFQTIIVIGIIVAYFSLRWSKKRRKV